MTPSRCTSSGRRGVATDDPVLHQHLRRIDIGAGLEHHIDGQRAVADRLRGDVKHVVDAVHLLLDRRGDGLSQHLGRCAGIGRADADRGRRDLGILGDRQRALYENARDGDDDRQHSSEDRPVDEEVREAHVTCLFVDAFSTESRGELTAPMDESPPRAPRRSRRHAQTDWPVRR